MKQITLSLPESLHQKAKEIAERDHLSLEQFVASAVEEKIVSEDYIARRAKRASKDKFQQVLTKIKSNEPYPYDRWE